MRVMRVVVLYIIKNDDYLMHSSIFHLIVVGAAEKKLLEKQKKIQFHA